MCVQNLSNSLETCIKFKLNVDLSLNKIHAS